MKAVNPSLVGQITQPRGRWVTGCMRHPRFHFPRNAWSFQAAVVMQGRAL